MFLLLKKKEYRKLSETLKNYGKDMCSVRQLPDFTPLLHMIVTLESKSIEKKRSKTMNSNPIIFHFIFLLQTKLLLLIKNLGNLFPRVLYWPSAPKAAFFFVCPIS